MHRRRRLLVSKVIVYPGSQAVDERVFRLLEAELRVLSGLRDDCLVCQPQHTIYRTHHQDLRLERTELWFQYLLTKLFVLLNQLDKLRVQELHIVHIRGRSAWCRCRARAGWDRAVDWWDTSGLGTSR